ncbi:hypothetical protein [uncultured Veillonella sp.]|uniref:hypothetical protein n=1 Tax=uncultured Veillonella sp. TaxID=159268 RepID=UPI0025E77E99|nr:hypothetical protein [uncultured Veillonella sp.]
MKKIEQLNKELRKHILNKWYSIVPNSSTNGVLYKDIPKKSYVLIYRIKGKVIYVTHASTLEELKETIIKNGGVFEVEPHGGNWLYCFTDVVIKVPKEWQ